MKLIEYADFECPFCGRAKEEAEAALHRLGNEVCYAFRHFPLTQLHPHALVAALAAEAAAAQDRFWEMHDVLFANQDALDPASILVHAGSIGLDVERFENELSAGVYLPRVKHDMASGIQSGVQGTPSFFVNGIRHEGGWDADALTPALRAALRPARVSSGRTAE